MSGLYSPINRLAESITRPKGTGAEYMTELQKKPGYKPAEAEDRDLQTLMALPQMERAAFMEKLKAQANKYPLKHRELTGAQTHHGDYTLPGGENYREILLHTPMPKGQGFEGRSHHFGGMPNILASIRVKDRMSPEGKKVLHLEEIQSDWHQQGREAGYQPKDLDNQIKEAFKNASHLTYELRHNGHGMDQYEYAETQKALEEADNELNRLDQLKEEGVPYGPHAKDWHELALKAMIQHAAENGYDQIAVTPGAEQAKRFSLSKQIGAMAYYPESRYFKALSPDKQKVAVAKEQVLPEHLPALIGKEAAAKLLQAPKTMGHHYLEGENLDIGGEGMKGFYDKMVPAFLNKFGKKHGVQVQRGSIETKPAREEPQLAAPGIGHFPPPIKHPAELAPVHTFDITPAMREDVLKNGIPRYEDGGIIHKAEGGSMNIPSTEQMKALLMAQKRGINGLSELQSVGVNEAPNLSIKAYLPPHGQDDMSGIPVGGVDINPMQPGIQLMQPPQGAPQPQAGGMPPQGQPAPDNGSNILQMTPQGQAMAAMRPAQPQAMADGGGVSGSGGIQVNIPLTVGGGGGGQMGGSSPLGDMAKMAQPPQPSTLGDMTGSEGTSPLLPQPLAKQNDNASGKSDIFQQMMDSLAKAQKSYQSIPDLNQAMGSNKLAGITGMATGGEVQGYADGDAVGGGYSLPDVFKQTVAMAKVMMQNNPKISIDEAMHKAGKQMETQDKWETQTKPALQKTFGALQPASASQNAVAKMRNTPEVVKQRKKRANEFLDQPTEAWKPPRKEIQAFDRTRIKDALEGFPDVEQSKFPRDVSARSSLAHVNAVYEDPENRDLIKKQIARGLPLGGETFYASLYPVKLAAMEAGIPPEKFDAWIHSIAPASARNSILNEMAVGQAIRNAHAEGSDLSPESLAKVRAQYKATHGIGLPMMPVHEEGVSNVLKNNLNLRDLSQANVPTNYKIPTYGAQKAGDFAHSWVGDVHEAMGETLGSEHHPYFTMAGGFKNPEYGAAENHMLDIAREMGIPGGTAQAGRWFGGGELTGLKSPRGDALDLLEKQVAYTLHQKGIVTTPQEVRNYVLQMISTGRGHLLPWFKKEGLPDMRVKNKKKGGKVTLQNDQDTMMLEISRKKKAK